MKKRLLSSFMAFLMVCSLVVYLPGANLIVSATQDRTANFVRSYSLTGNGATDMVNIARAQVNRTQSDFGYTEAWCADFVSDCAKLAGQTSAIAANGSCYSMMSDVKNKGGYVVPKSDAKAGDLVFFSSSSYPNGGAHVEIVYEYSAGKLKSIGGNCNINGAWRVYDRANGSSSSVSFYCVIRPNYSGSPPTDTTPPVISDIEVYDVSANGYSVAVHVTDSGGSGVSRVRFPTWTVNNDQDDIIWADGDYVGEHAYFRVNTSDHHNELGLYRTHIYAYDNAGNSSSAGIDTMLENIAPKISDVKVTDISVNGYTVECTVTDDGGSGLDRVQFPTWTTANGQDDLMLDWGSNSKASGSINGNKVTYRVNITDHNNEYGTYRTHIYAYDKSGNQGGATVSDVSVGIGHEMTESEAAGQTIPDGEYWIFSELGRHIYLDIPGVEAPAKSNTKIIVTEYSTRPEKYDSWKITYLNNGFYKITQNGQKVAVDVTNASLNHKTKVQTYEDNETIAQQWSIKETTDHGYTIQSRANGYYLDVANAKIGEDGYLQTHEGNGSKAQSWCFVPFYSDDRPIEDGEYYIKSAAGEAYLDVDGDFNYTNGANVQVWNNKADIFNLTYVGNGYYTVIEKTTGLSLDVEDGDEAAFLNRKNIQLWEYNPNNKRGQLWRIVDEGNGNYRLISMLSGYSLDLAGMKTANGTNVQQHPYNTSNAQKWSLEKVHDHSYTEKVVAATCTSKGYTLHKCSTCGNEYKDTYTNATGHKFGSWTVTKKATCTATGTQTRKCSTCGETETQTIKATGHNYSTQWTVDKAATCTSDGSKSHHCTVCGEKKDITTIAKTAHSFGEWTTTDEAICTEGGTQERKCSVCGETETKTIDATGHKYITTVIAPTCIKKGYTVHKCSICGDEYRDSYTNAKGHKYETIVVDPTCEEGGYTMHKCTVCDKSYTDSETDPAGHKFGKWTVIKAATCTANGIQERKCTVCGETEKQSINKIAHQYEATVVAPTCTENGYTLHKCSLCGISYTDTETYAVGHRFGEWKVTKAPSCTIDGTQNRTCSVCGELESKTIKASGHSYSAEWTIDKQATCAEQGLKSHHCVNCDETTELTAIPKTTDHNYTNTVTKQATDVQTGIKTYTCSICGKSYTEVIPAKGHSYDNEIITKEPTCTDNGIKTYKCKTCDETYIEVVPAVGHEYDNGKVTKQSTCTENGVMTYTCNNCGDTYTTEIKAIGHNYKTATTKATLSKNGSIVEKCTVCGTKKSTTAIYYPKTITLAKTSYVYNGKVQKPAVTVKDAKGKVIAKSNYTVTYSSGCKNVGKYAVKVTFKGNYSGAKMLYYTIIPKGTAISRLTAAKRGFTAVWAKNTTQTTGYQIQYTTDSKFKSGVKTVTINKNTTVSKAISKLTGGKKYYVRVRTYRNANKVNYFSAWSGAKAVTTKK